MSNPNPRKRAAPGAGPSAPIQQPQMQNQYAQNMANDQMIRWNGGTMPDAGGYMDNVGNPMPSMDLVQSQPQFTQNNSLARISNNRALVSTKNAYGGNFNGSQGWGAFGNEDNQLVPHGHEENRHQDDNVEELEERAQKAKREAQAKRKQIPPFVQKLSR